jgi:hypothetical protein
VTFTFFSSSENILLRRLRYYEANNSVQLDQPLLKHDAPVIMSKKKWQQSDSLSHAHIGKSEA